MYNKNTKLELKELPPRAENLSEADVKNIFGGCGGANDDCDKNHDCCDYYTCSTFKCAHD